MIEGSYRAFLCKCCRFMAFTLPVLECDWDTELGKTTLRHHCSNPGCDHHEPETVLIEGSYREISPHFKKPGVPEWGIFVDWSLPIEERDGPDMWVADEFADASCEFKEAPDYETPLVATARKESRCTHVTPRNRGRYATPTNAS